MKKPKYSIPFLHFNNISAKILFANLRYTMILHLRKTEKFNRLLEESLGPLTLICSDTDKGPWLNRVYTLFWILNISVSYNVGFKVTEQHLLSLLLRQAVRSFIVFYNFFSLQNIGMLLKSIIMTSEWIGVLILILKFTGLYFAQKNDDYSVVFQNARSSPNYEAMIKAR